MWGPSVSYGYSHDTREAWFTLTLSTAWMGSHHSQSRQSNGVAKAAGPCNNIQG